MVVDSDLARIVGGSRGQRRLKKRNGFQGGGGLLHGLGIVAVCRTEFDHERKQQHTRKKGRGRQPRRAPSPSLKLSWVASCSGVNET